MQYFSSLKLLLLLIVILGLSACTSSRCRFPDYSDAMISHKVLPIIVEETLA